jgi:E3 ubiquitin-protein ligase RFWD2
LTRLFWLEQWFCTWLTRIGMGHVVVLGWQGEVSVKELDSLLALLADKKHKAEQEEAESNMEILLEFLHRSRQAKQDELNELQGDLEFLKEDIACVEKQRQELLRSKARFSRKIRILFDVPPPQLDGLVSDNSSTGGAISLLRNGQGGAGVPSHSPQRRGEGKHWSSSGSSLKRDPYGDPEDWNVGDSQGLSSTRVSAAKKRRVLDQFEDLQECYLQKRRTKVADRVMSNAIKDVDSNSDPWAEERRTGLDDFHSVLTAITRYGKLRVIAELRHGDLFHSSNIVSSIEFDRDDEYFATAGVSRRIKVFEFSTVVNELADVHCPVVEMTTRSKLSCLSWNKYIKSHIASSDYEGIVTVWDVNTHQSIMEYEEHEKRAWSVDFSKKEPTRLVSGSDDEKVKVWCTRQETSVMNIDMKANICCVKYNPVSSNFIAVGSADHRIHYYDLRHIAQPLFVLSPKIQRVFLSICIDLS